MPLRAGNYRTEENMAVVGWCSHRVETIPYIKSKGQSYDV